MIGLIKMQRRQKRLVKKHPSTIPVHLSLVIGICIHIYINASTHNLFRNYLIKQSLIHKSCNKSHKSNPAFYNKLRMLNRRIMSLMPQIMQQHYNIIL